MLCKREIFSGKERQKREVVYSFLSNLFGFVFFVSKKDRAIGYSFFQAIEQGFGYEPCLNA
jgi:hypothetical protein